jgi:hypothetical protein
MMSHLPEQSWGSGEKTHLAGLYIGGAEDGPVLQRTPFPRRPPFGPGDAAGECVRLGLA